MELEMTSIFLIAILFATRSRSEWDILSYKNDPDMLYHTKTISLK